MQLRVLPMRLDFLEVKYGAYLLLLYLSRNVETETETWAEIVIYHPHCVTTNSDLRNYVLIVGSCICKTYA